MAAMSEAQEHERATNTERDNMMFTPDVVEEIPTTALMAVTHTLEGLGDFLAKLDDYEDFIIRIDGEIQGFVHMMDAELRRRAMAVEEGGVR
jgi:hypothetical protein